VIIERAELPIIAELVDEFSTLMATRGKAILAGAAGCLFVYAGRGVEHPDRFILLLGWNAVEDHVAFTTTDAFAEFRGLLGSFVAGAPAMEHFTLV
jgi:quinol monooxygenase YgiN